MKEWKDMNFVEKRLDLFEVAKKLPDGKIKETIISGGVDNEDTANSVRMMIIATYGEAFCEGV